MPVPREAIQQALFDRLSQIAGFKTKTRRMVHFDDVRQDAQPALLVTGTGGMADQQSDLPMFTWLLSAHVYLYVREPADKSLTAETQIHSFLDRIEAELGPQVGESQPFAPNGTTLGGRVQSCIVTGYAIDVFGDGQTVTTVRIEMVVAE